MNIIIQKSITRLAETSGATSMKFFGKIMGTQKDYWIAQGILPEEEEVPTNPKVERRGNGVNTSVFWVCNELN